MESKNRLINDDSDDDDDTKVSVCGAVVSGVA